MMLYITGTFKPSGAGSVSVASTSTHFVLASSVASSTQLVPSTVVQSGAVGSCTSNTGGFSFNMNQQTPSLSGQLNGVTSGQLNGVTSGAVLFSGYVCFCISFMVKVMHCKLLMNSVSFFLKNLDHSYSSL